MGMAGLVRPLPTPSLLKVRTRRVRRPCLPLANLAARSIYDEASWAALIVMWLRVSKSNSCHILGNANCIIRMAENNPSFEKIRQQHGHNLGGWVAALVVVGCTAVVAGGCCLPTSRRTHEAGE